MINSDIKNDKLVSFIFDHPIDTIKSIEQEPLQEIASKACKLITLQVSQIFGQNEHFRDAFTEFIIRVNQLNAPLQTANFSEFIDSSGER